ncbi:hypothetical protein Plhal304r1_c002g0009231 [Plasmopara halstedii]
MSSRDLWRQEKNLGANFKHNFCLSVKQQVHTSKFLRASLRHGERFPTDRIYRAQNYDVVSLEHPR